WIHAIAYSVVASVPMSLTLPGPSNTTSSRSRLCSRASSCALKASTNSSATCRASPIRRSFRRTLPRDTRRYSPVANGTRRGGRPRPRRRRASATLAPPALLAQLVEHLHGKEGVDGSSPSEGSLQEKNCPQMGG